jgi:hypothetical protein
MCRYNLYILSTFLLDDDDDDDIYPVGEEVAGGWRRMHTEELRNL